MFAIHINDTHSERPASLPSQDIVFPSNKKPVIPIVLISTFIFARYPPTDCNKLSPIVLMRDFFCN